MKVTTDLRPGIAVEFEQVRDVSMAWVRLPDLTGVTDEELGRAWRHAVNEAFMAQGAERGSILARALDPIRAELRRRGLEPDGWSADGSPPAREPAGARREGPGAEDDVAPARQRALQLRDLNEVELRQAHLRAMRRVFHAGESGPACMGMHASLLKPVEAEMRRRGLEAGYWSARHRSRQAAASWSALN